MNKKHLALIIAAALLLVMGISSTVAYLISRSDALENTFTVGDVSITLNETTGSTYTMAPGVTLYKDPIVTVKALSESCWLFVKVEKTANFDRFCTYEIQEGWISLSENEGIYYQKIERSTVDKSFSILRNNRVTVKDTLTEEELNAVTDNPTLKFTAYAVQSEGIATAHEAWQILNQ